MSHSAMFLLTAVKKNSLGIFFFFEQCDLSSQHLSSYLMCKTEEQKQNTNILSFNFCTNISLQFHITSSKSSDPVSED